MVKAEVYKEAVGLEAGSDMAECLIPFSLTYETSERKCILQVSGRRQKYCQLSWSSLPLVIACAWRVDVLAPSVAVRAAAWLCT